MRFCPVRLALFRAGVKHTRSHTAHTSHTGACTRNLERPKPQPWTTRFHSPQMAAQSPFRMQTLGPLAWQMYQQSPLKTARRLARRHATSHRHSAFDRRPWRPMVDPQCNHENPIDQPRPIDAWPANSSAPFRQPTDGISAPTPSAAKPRNVCTTTIRNPLTRPRPYPRRRLTRPRTCPPPTSGAAPLAPSWPHLWLRRRAATAMEKTTPTTQNNATHYM